MQLKQLPILFAQIDCSDDRPGCDCTEAEGPYIQVGEDSQKPTAIAQRLSIHIYRLVKIALETFLYSNIFVKPVCTGKTVLSQLERSALLDKSKQCTLGVLSSILVLKVKLHKCIVQDTEAHWMRRWGNCLH